MNELEGWTWDVIFQLQGMESNGNLKPAEKVIHNSTPEEEHGEEEHLEKLTTSKLAKKLNVTTSDMEKILLQEGYLIIKDDKLFLSPQGEACGGEWRYNKYKKGGTYFLWPESIIAELNQKGVSAK